MISRRDFARNMRRVRRDVQEKRYRYLNTWCTDGILAFRHLADTTRRPPKRMQQHFRLGDVQDKLSDIKTAAGEQDPSKHFGSIVGIDLGHVFSAAAFALPTDPLKSGSELKISNRSLYGRQRRNDRWLEQRKVVMGIAYLEEELSAHSKHVASLESFVTHVRVWQRENRLHRLPDFYGSPAVVHRRWDSRMSSMSALDLSCELLERLAGNQSIIPPPSPSGEQSLDQMMLRLQSGDSSSSSSSRPSPSQSSRLQQPSVSSRASLSSSPHQPQSPRRPHEREIPEKPTLFILGDAEFSHTRKGLQSSKHSKLAARLVKRIKDRYANSLCVGIDEYNTSRHCPRCLGRLQYMRRKPRGVGELKRKTKGEDGLVDDFRVQFCGRYVPFTRYNSRLLGFYAHILCISAAMSTLTETVRPHSPLRSSSSPYSPAVSGMHASRARRNRARNRTRDNDARESWAGERPRTNV